jgi:hypothetical protein
MELRGRTHDMFPVFKRSVTEHEHVDKDLVSVQFSPGKKNYGVKYDVYVCILRHSEPSILL